MSEQLLSRISSDLNVLIKTHDQLKKDYDSTNSNLTDITLKYKSLSYNYTILQKEVHSYKSKNIELEEKIASMKEEHKERKDTSQIGINLIKYLNKNDRMNNDIKKFFESLSTLSLTTDLYHCQCCVNECDGECRCNYSNDSD